MPRALQHDTAVRVTILQVADTEGLLTAGQAALRNGDAVTARECFEAAAAGGAGPRADEGLARARYLDVEFAEAIGLWESAYSGYRADGDDAGAIRVARTLAGVVGQTTGDWAVGRGWLARAETLSRATPAGAEEGWIALNRGMFEPDRDRKNELFAEALTSARTHHDRDLEFVALAYLGASHVHADRQDEGMVLLDEALAAVAGGEVDDFCVLEEIFCQLFSACEYARDVVRADQWIRVGEALAERRRLPAVSAFCRTHYGGVLTAAGRWPEADAALTEAVQLWSSGHRAGLRGGALARLADLRVRQGRIEEAAQLLDDLPAEDPEVARPLAAVHLAAGRFALARHTLERALDRVAASSAAAVPLLALLVDVELAADDRAAATQAAASLAEVAGSHDDPYARAVSALANGRVCLASGEGDPLGCLRDAMTGFAQAQLPMELARARLDTAAALASAEPEVALAEARAALDALERLQAARDVDAAAALLRRLGVRVPARRSTGDVLTRREAEVLDLITEGLSNPEISDRLYISRKTVEHHVSAILAKLGLRTRAEVVAYATRRKSADK
jgi:DNA-binding NarL/FixJ family response regulator